MKGHCFTMQRKTIFLGKYSQLSHKGEAPQVKRGGKKSFYPYMMSEAIYFYSQEFFRWN